VEEEAGGIRRHGEADQAHEEVHRPPGRHPEHDDEHGEQQGREPDVVLQADHADGEHPGHGDGNEGPGVDDQAVTDPGGRDREELLSLDEVGGEEQAQQHLAQLHRLELEPADVYP